jgi:hypothetical protein
MMKWRGAVASAVALIALSGCGDNTADDAKAAKDVSTANPTTAAADTVTTEPTTAAPVATFEPPKLADFVLAVKTTRKQCFGSAGCNVTYHIDVTVNKDVGDPDKEYLVTYEVSGVQDGPAINSFTIQGTKYSRDEEETAQTKSSKSKLTAKVTSVEEN